MRCPKCQYISFGVENRCRNCGYDFSLSSNVEPLDLPIKNASERIGPMTDLPLAASPRPHALKADSGLHVEPGAPKAATRQDLPLFSVAPPDDAPLVTPPAVPRAPLAVRRAPPIITRPRQQPSVEDESDRDRGERRRRSASASDGEGAHDNTDAAGAASSGARMLAGMLDVSLMAAIDLAVIYLTLRLLGLEIGDVRVLPVLPMIAFFLLLNGGYLVLFTAAGGQTLGKMTVGIKVVRQPPEADSRVPFGAAVLRAAAFLASLLPGGLGLLPILFSPDGRALHDRLSNTRVVKA